LIYVYLIGRSAQFSVSIFWYDESSAFIHKTGLSSRLDIAI